MTEAQRSPAKRVLGVAPWALYAVCAALLISFRMPWVDEAWYAGPAVTLLRDGRMLEVGSPLPTEGAREAPLIEAWALVLAGWFSVFGVDFLRARVLSAVAGAAILALGVRALREAATPSGARTAVTWLFATSTFLLGTATWMRPDTATVALCVAGAISAARWAETGGRRWLAAAHVALIVASAFHLMACFVGLALWVATLGCARRPRRGDLLAFAAPYGAALALGAWIYHDRLDALAYAFARWFFGDMVGHSSSIAGAFARWIGDGRWGEVVTMSLFVAAVVAGPWLFVRDRRSPAARVLALTAWGAALAWFATTESGANYHLVWVTPALMLGVAAVWRPDGGFVTPRAPLLVPAAGLAVLGVVFTATEVAGNTLAGYRSDLDRFDVEYGLRQAELTGPREIQWHYDFAPHALRHFADGHRPEWLIALTPRKSELPETERRGGRTYQVVDRGEIFALYRRSD